MLYQILSRLFDEALGKLHQEISAYPDTASLWVTAPGTANSGGTLCLHLVGNLNHFIGARLGNTGYVRNRPQEFSRRDVPREELLQLVTDTREMIKAVFGRLPAAVYERPFPEEVLGGVQNTGFFMTYLVGHLNYHLGQINYHRRITQETKNK